MKSMRAFLRAQCFYMVFYWNENPYQKEMTGEKKGGRFLSIVFWKHFRRRLGAHIKKRPSCLQNWKSYKKKEAGPGKACENICGRYLSIIRLIWNHCKKYNSRTVILTVKKYEKHTYRPLIFSSTEV